MGSWQGSDFIHKVNLIHQFPLEVVKGFSVQSLTDSICESLSCLHEKVDSFIFAPNKYFMERPLCSITLVKKAVLISDLRGANALGGETY